MKKLFAMFAVLQLLMVPATNVWAQEETTVAEVQDLPQYTGEALVSQIREYPEIYRVVVTNQEDNVLLDQSNVSFDAEQAEIFAKMLEENSTLSLDLGDGQYQLDVASAYLFMGELHFVATAKMDYSVVFHEGLVTQSGIIFEDSSDKVLTTVQRELSDVTEWLEKPSDLYSTDTLELVVDGKDYFGTQPYFESVNGELIDSTTTVMIGNYRLSKSPLAIHFNVVPRVAAPAAVSQSETTVDNPVESTTPSSQENASVAVESEVESSESSVASSNTVQVSVQQATELAANTTQGPSLPATGEAGNTFIWVAIALVIIGALVILLPKRKQK